jgi:hypothetical protein
VVGSKRQPHPGVTETVEAGAGRSRFREHRPAL